MKAYQALPEGYHEILRMDLQKNKKDALIINGIGLAVMLIMGVGMHFAVPVTEIFDLEDGLGAYVLRFAVMCAGYAAYIVLHELTHAAAMKAVGGGKVRFGFTGLYAFAGSETDWFDKGAYRLIALAPLVVWGVIFGVLQGLVPRPWFWVIWLWQIGNVSGAAGDVYVTVRLWPKPRDILVRDTGVAMTVCGTVRTAENPSAV